MRQTWSCSKWVFVLFVPFIILLLTHSPVHGKWTAVSPPAVSGEWWLSDVYFASADEGWAVGGSYLDPDFDTSTGVLLHYQNGSWTSVTPPVVSTRWFLSGVHFTSADEGWAVGNGSANFLGKGVLLHYQNGSWTSVTPPEVRDSWALSGVYFTSADEGWAVGGNGGNATGVLLHYQNGSWTSVTPPEVGTGWDLFGVHFTSADEGWAVAYPTSTKLLHYQNGSWTSVTPPEVSDIWALSGVYFTSADEGWAVGDDWANYRGVLLHYQNGSWTSVTPPEVSDYWYLFGVHFTSADEGWAVGDNNDNLGVLLHYQNGSWTSVTPPELSGRWGLRKVHFTSADEGWAVGERNTRGVLLGYSTDPKVTLVKPNGGEIASAGSPSYQVTWTATSAMKKFKLSYSIDAGITWTPITTGFLESTSATWSVPTFRKNNTTCLVKVVAFDASGNKLGSDKSDRPFTIEVLTITNINGGAPCTSGQVCRIEWTKASAVNAASGVLSYSLDNGTTWKNITATISGTDAFYDWTPSVTKTKTKCKVKLVLKDASGKKVGSDTSDGVFTIQKP